MPRPAQLRGLVRHAGRLAAKMSLIATLEALPIGQENGLYFNNTEKPALLAEVYFCDRPAIQSYRANFGKSAAPSLLRLPAGAG
jgi:hypothetical protein